MKLKYYIISLVLATSCGYLASCSDDDDDKIVNSELTFGVDALRVKIGEENKTLISSAVGIFLALITSYILFNLPMIQTILNAIK